jgi:hypothetical protein
MLAAEVAVAIPTAVDAYPTALDGLFLTGNVFGDHRP